jgi:2-oxoisovalerate dehydrogenase E2 component (dihydrolipoyl transacylase)
MARYLFRLPDVGEGVTEAEIMDWYVKPGDRVEEDHPLVDVMTDKANVEMTSPVSGTVIAIHGEVGDIAAVGSTIVELEIEGDEEAEDTAAAGTPEVQPQTAAATPAAGHEPVRHVSTSAPLAAPATRRRAEELGVALEKVTGSGPGGRITPSDLDDFVARQGEISGGVTESRIIGLRRQIAAKMQDAKSRIPHFSYVEEFDLSELESLRRSLNENRSTEQAKLTLLPFFIRAIVRLQPEFPDINARYDDDAGVLRSYDSVHIGIATQTDGGLMVPVVRNAETLDLWDCARELARVTTAAREGSATREELTGSTITLTSLGALGGIAATPVINSPEVAIIGPNKLVERPVVRDGDIVIRTVMNVSASFDHRIIDGYVAASFIQALKLLIEDPQSIGP